MPTKPAKKKMGRPNLPKGEAKGRVLVIRFKQDDLKRIEGAAKASKQSVSEWVRTTVAAAIGA